MIRYLPYNEIDKTRWDQCIRDAPNGLIYGYSFYLDAMCRNWDALVLDDYTAVMPLTWNRKWSIYYLYQPAFTACLGVFGKAINADLVNEFLTHIPAHFKYWDIRLNAGNFFSIPGFKLHQRMNYTLSLGHSYEELQQQYRDNIRRNITRHHKSGNIISNSISPTEVLNLAKQMPAQYGAVSEVDFNKFNSLAQQLIEKGMAKVYGVKNPAGELLAGCIFLFSHSRAYYILPANHPNGRTMGASHALIDAFIRDHSQQPLLLDFEGSDISSLAFFYSSFGATQEKYSAIKLNRLPAWIKWLKK